MLFVFNYVVLAVVDICRRYQNVTELNLHGVINAETLVLEAIMFLRSQTLLPHFLSLLLLIPLSFYCIYRMEYLVGI
jgi:hypothetical protein